MENYNLEDWPLKINSLDSYSKKASKILSINNQFRKAQLYNKNGFKGLHGKFLIEGNLSKQKLKIYKISEKKFIEVY